MKKRQTIFILFLIIILIGVFSLRLYRIEPYKIFETGGVYTYFFNKVFSRADLLNFSFEDDVSFFELHFSNNRVLRYVRGSSGAGLPLLSRWRDPVGRTRVAPVVIIECDLSSKSILAIGKDYTIYCFYERGSASGSDFDTSFLCLARFNIEWLTDGKDTINFS